MTTKVPAELSSTPSIVDNGNATALTIDSDENIGFNTTGIAAGSTSSSQNSTATPKKIVVNNDYSSGYTDASLKLYLFNSGTTRQGFTSGPAYDLQYHSSGHATGRHAFYVGNTESARIDADGIKFNGDSAAVNALDDYEEGTWTPQITGSAGSAGSAAYSNQMGRYTKIGNKVFFEFSVVMTNKGSWSSYTRVLGFPFTSSSSGLTAFAVARFPDDTIGQNMIAGELQPSSTLCFFTTGSRLDTLHNISNVDTGYYLVGAGHYSI